MWKPIELDELLARISSGERAMDVAMVRLWEAIRVDPSKWQLPPWGDEGGGFWVVALCGRHALWFNDIEGGFNISTYRRFGVIEQYWCNQDELQHSLYSVQQLVESGFLIGGYGPPQPITERL